MTLDCLGSSSRGNCYILTDRNGRRLIIEAGVPFREVKRAIGYSLSSVEGVIVTHEHRDHSRAVPDMLAAGLTVMALPEVYRSFDNLRARTFGRNIQPQHGYRAGAYKIIAIGVMHDVPCVGYVIDHPEMGRLLFATDTYDLTQTVPGLHTIMMEANYSIELLNESIESGETPATMRGRLSVSHMEIRTTEAVIRAQDTAETRNIILLHLSSGHAAGAEFKARIERATGVPTTIATAGLHMELA